MLFSEKMPVAKSDKTENSNLILETKVVAHSHYIVKKNN